MKENQKLLLLCGDSYQNISLLATVTEAQKLNAKDGNALVLYLGEENTITQEVGEQVVVSKLKLDALRTTLLSYTGSRLLLTSNATVVFISRRINDASFKSWAIRYPLPHWLVRFAKPSSFLKAFNFPL